MTTNIPPATTSATSVTSTNAPISFACRLKNQLASGAASGFGCESIACPPHGLDVQRAALQLLAQPRDVHVHGAHRVEGRAPHQVQQLLAVERHVREARERRQQVELLRRERQLSPFSVARCVA